MARRLVVEIIGDPTSAQRALRTVGRETSFMERRFGVAGRAANTSFRRIGAGARAATPYVSAFAVLGLGKAVIEAEEAVKAGRQTDAVIKSMGGSANVNRRHVEELANSLSELSAVDDEMVQSAENLLLTFGNIRNEAGKGNKIFDETTRLVLDMSAALGQDLKSSSIQLGKALNDPTVGLTALRRVGVSFNDTQTETIQKLFESGQQMKAQKLILAELRREFAGSAAAQATPLERLKVAGENLAESIGLRILPGLEDMATELSSILNDPKLSGEEKIDRIASLFERGVIKGIEKLEDAAPQIARVGGRIGLRMAAAFGRSFLESDILGKLFLGGLLLRVLGGPGAFLALGRLIGGRVGMGVGQGMATTVPGATGGRGAAGAARPSRGTTAFRGGLGLAGGPLGIAAFGAIHNWTSPDASPQFTGLDESIKKSVTNQIRSSTLLTKALRKDVAERIRLLAREGSVSEEWANQTLGSLGTIARSQIRGEVNRNLHSLEKLVGTRMGNIAGVTKKDMDAVRKAMQQSPERGRAVLAKTYDRIVAKIRRAMDDGKISTEKGMAAIERLTVRKLKLFGVKSISIAVEQGGGAGGGGGGGGGGTGGAFQRGGTVVPGTGSGDKVPLHIGGRLAAMVESGELVSVANRTATNALMQHNANVPRRAQGGGVSLPRYRGNYPVAGVGAGGLNLTAAAGERLLKRAARSGNLAGTGNLVALGHALERMGYLVGEHPAFGGVAPGVHDPGGYHPLGRAIDVNWANVTQEPARLDRIHGPLSRNPNVVELLWREEDHYDHLHLAMQKGGRVPGPKHGAHWIHGGASDSPGGHRWTVDEAATLLWQVGASKSEAKNLARYVPGESSGDARVVNSIGAAGLFQILQSAHGSQIARFSRKFGGKGILDPRVNAAVAIDILRSEGYGAWEAAPVGGPGKLLHDLIGTGKSSGRGGSGGGGPSGTGGLNIGKIGSGGFTGSPAGLGGAGGGGGGGGLNLGALGGPGLSYQDKLGLIDIAMARAEGTAGTEDDRRVLEQRARLLARRVNRDEQRIKQINRRLRRDDLSKKERRALRGRRGELISDLGGVVSDLDSTRDQLGELGAGGAGGASDIAELLKQIRDELKEQNAIMGAEGNIQNNEILRGLVDVLSGELGPRVNLRGQTAGAGSVVRS